MDIRVHSGSSGLLSTKNVLLAAGLGAGLFIAYPVIKQLTYKHQLKLFEKPPEPIRTAADFVKSPLLNPGLASGSLPPVKTEAAITTTGAATQTPVAPADRVRPSVSPVEMPTAVKRAVSTGTHPLRELVSLQTMETARLERDLTQWYENSLSLTNSYFDPVVSAFRRGEPVVMPHATEEQRGIVRNDLYPGIRDLRENFHGALFLELAYNSNKIPTYFPAFRAAEVQAFSRECLKAMIARTYHAGNHLARTMEALMDKTSFAGQMAIGPQLGKLQDIPATLMRVVDQNRVMSEKYRAGLDYSDYRAITL